MFEGLTCQRKIKITETPEESIRTNKLQLQRNSDHFKEDIYNNQSCKTNAVPC